MTIKSRKFTKGIRTKPTTDAATLEGEQRTDSASNEQKIYLDGAERSVVTSDQTQTVENKTIDGTSATGNNTVSIDASDASYDNGTSGLSATDTQAAIDEIDGRVDADEQALADHLADTVDSHDASAISNVPAGNLAATDVQGALDELQTDIDTRATSTELNDHITDAVDAHDASAISNTPAGNLAATDVQGALDELQTDVDSRALDSALTDHINDVADAHDASAVSVVPSGNLTSGDVQNALVELQTDIDNRATSTELSDHLTDTSTHGVGEIVGTTETQALSNKDIDGGTASNTSRLTVPQDTKTNLDGLTRKEATLVYANDQDKLYIDNGSDLIGVGSGDGVGINYNENPDFELNADGYNTYNDGNVVDPVDGTGGSVSGLAITRNTTTPLRGDADGKIALTGALTKGQGVSFDVDVDLADQSGKFLEVSFDYDFSDLGLGYFKVYLYDITNSKLIKAYWGEEPTSLKGEHKAYFISSGGSQYRVILHQYADTSASADLFIDNVLIGPIKNEQVFQNGFVSDTTEIVCDGSFTTNTTYSGKYRRVGDKAHLDVTLTFSGVPNATTFTLNYPPSLPIDTSKLNSTSSFIENIGDGTITEIGVGIRGLTVNYGGAVARVYNVHTNAAVTQANPIAIGAGDSISLRLIYPVVGWSTGVPVTGVAKNSTPVVMRAEGNGSEGITANTEDIYFIASDDVKNTWDGSGFTAPEDGDYLLEGSTRHNPVTATIRTYIDGVEDKTIFASPGSRAQDEFSAIVKLEAGQRLSLRTTGGFTLVNNARDHHLTIIKIANPSSFILPTDQVVCIVGSDNGQTVNNGDNIIFENIISDDTNSYNSSTGVFTAPIAGKYRVSGNIRNSSTASIFTNIVINGTDSLLTAQADGLPYSFGGIFELAKGETISIKNDTGSSRTLSAQIESNRMFIERLR